MSCESQWTIPLLYDPGRAIFLGAFDPDCVWHDLAQVWQTPQVGEQAVAQMISMPAGVQSPAEHFDQSGRARCISVALRVV